MKKLVSLLLAVCMCISFAVTLTGCGAKNAWQEYLGNVVFKSDEIKMEEGAVGANKDGYLLKGTLEVAGDGSSQSITANMRDQSSHEKATDGISNYDDYRYIEYQVFYNFKSNTLSVEVGTYQYYTLSFKDKNGKTDWKDGFGFTGTGTCLTLRFDMTGYFENGELTADDITENSDFNMDILTTDYKGIAESKYTERNTEWKSQTMNGIISSINETVKLIDDYLKDNPV